MKGDHNTVSFDFVHLTHLMESPNDTPDENLENQKYFKYGESFRI